MEDDSHEKREWATPGRRLSTKAFYNTYHGHDVEHLEIAHEVLSEKHESIIYLAGDSSLDNKFWFKFWHGSTFDALNGYEDFLAPPTMQADVSYWLNWEAVQRGLDICCINSSVEATALNDRPFCHLLSQDRFIGRHITGNDYLVVSVGGNDIALKPVLLTILNMLVLIHCTPQVCLERCACGCAPNLCIDDGCFCCGLPGCVSTLCAWPLGLGYFINLFRNTIQNYILKILGCRRPRKVLVCMIYFPDERATGGWADNALGFLRYDAEPHRLQNMIRTVFKLATSKICIPGTEVVPVPLFEVMDGRTTDDYIERVEPSITGGKKMASAIMDVLLEEHESSSEGQSPAVPPRQHNMR